MTDDANVLTPAVLIIGGGPSGLRAAAELAPHVSGQVLVVERESSAGGIPRHSDHPGYGIRDLGKFISGPKYAKILRDKATRAGARILTDTMVTDWAGELSVNATSPIGRIRIDARAIVLATGARERPRPARLIPGDRSHGIYTTGNLQNVVHLKHGTVGKRAVIVGAELVSWSAALTLQHVKCKTVLMTTEYPKPDSYFFFSAPGKIFFGTKVATRTRVTRIIGRPSVEAVEIENLDTGERQQIACDTVILTGDWIPDNELARAAHLPIDPVSKSPIVDEALRTTRPGLFAVGNLLHPVDTADIAALDGAAVADHVLDYLRGVSAPTGHVDVRVDAPFRWVSPGRVTLGSVEPPRNRLLLWSDKFVAFPLVTMRQEGQVVAKKRLWWPAAPGRVFRIPSSMFHGLDRRRGAITIGLNE
ncbi:NAD(P)/FAD-dependent oxidoreductase [Leifsonia sp. Root112D2]|uniref:NAD(P)/FAD-dependent oxidoreductase n=1 Tax=Leifsonia sp. Root112D2 TaxID=1736426 RepID=UPI0006FA65E2|nr:FAD-dependent oxidoreductase [Leifsonia sp. Root112D2]KQV07085.1 pyridine nucleotide-disulfide oxidoreductase [Leifsonia sp. Root112D2]